VDPAPDQILLRKSGSAGNRSRTSGSVARNAYYKTTEAVLKHITRDGIVVQRYSLLT
jgi:hypothetical protein